MTQLLYRAMLGVPAVDRPSSRCGQDPQRSWFLIIALSPFICGPLLLFSACSNKKARAQGDVQTQVTGDAKAATLRAELPAEVAQRDLFAAAVAAIDDANGDGVSDFIVSDPAPWGFGTVWLVSGKEWRIMRTYSSTQYGGRFGHSLGDLGDLDGDGVAEIAISAHPPIRSVDVASVAVYSVNKSDARFVIENIGCEPSTGYARPGPSVLPVVDLSGDGIRDLCVAAPTGGELKGGEVRLHSGVDGSMLRRISGPKDAFMFGEALFIWPSSGQGRGPLHVGIVARAVNGAATVIYRWDVTGVDFEEHCKVDAGGQLLAQNVSNPAPGGKRVISQVLGAGKSRCFMWIPASDKPEVIWAQRGSWSFGMNAIQLASHGEASACLAVTAPGSDSTGSCVYLLADTEDRVRSSICIDRIDCAGFGVSIAHARDAARPRGSLIIGQSYEGADGARPGVLREYDLAKGVFVRAMVRP